VQLVKAVLPAGELEFDGQARHVEFAEAPTAVDYVPVPQSVHGTTAFQKATKPELTTLSSAVNNTCMYPVLDV
jgi:hypothetical protein